MVLLYTMRKRSDREMIAAAGRLGNTNERLVIVRESKKFPPNKLSPSGKLSYMLHLALTRRSWPWHLLSYWAYYNSRWQLQMVLSVPRLKNNNFVMPRSLSSCHCFHFILFLKISIRFNDTNITGMFIKLLLNYINNHKKVAKEKC